MLRFFLTFYFLGKHSNKLWVNGALLHLTAAKTGQIKLINQK